MVSILPGEMHSIAPLFADMHDTLILSCLQGHMGTAWADDSVFPTCAMLIVANFCYVAGDPTAKEAQTLIKNLPPSGYGKGDLYVVPQNEKWVQLLLCKHPNAITITRYAIKHEGDIFDRDKLRSMIHNISAGFQLQRFDEQLYNQAMANDWSRDLCGHFNDASDYLTRGRGFGILCDNHLVSGASSYTIYDGGIEIEIDTHKDFRRKGLALVCAALILNCLEAGIYPSWDAANLASVALSEKLGYHFDREYKAYCLPSGPVIRDDSPVFEVKA